MSTPKMAEKYEGSFVSKSSIESERSNRKSYLEKELEQARGEFEAKKKLKELQVQRGETTWMLPSLNERLKKDEERADKKKQKKKKKKHEKKANKHKKGKKQKKRQQLSSSAESSDDEWVEKQEETQEEQTTSNETADIGVAEKQLLDENETQSKREDWMMSESLFDSVVNSSESVAEKRARKKEMKKAEMKPSIDLMGQHKNELNPFWKDGGTGVPTEKASESSKAYRVGDAGLSWVKKAYERAKQQAEEQGRSLEDVVAERWGSMEKLNALLRNEEKRTRRTEGREERRGWRSKESKIEHGRERWKKPEEKRFVGLNETVEKSVRDGVAENRIDSEVKFPHLLQQKPFENRDERDVVKSQAEPSFSPRQGVSTATKERHSPRKSSSSESNESGDSDGSVSDGVEETEALSEKDINEISAKILRAELMGEQEVADRLKAKLEAGRRIASRKDTSVQRKSSTKIEKDAGKEEEEVVLTRTDRHGNVYPLKVSGDDPEPKRKRRKTKKIETHDAKGNRLRYFQEDDTTDLKSMVEEERLTTAEDQQAAVMSRLTKKLGNTMGDYYTLDDMFESSSASKASRGEKDEKAKKKAIAEQQKIMTQQANCRFCFENPEVAKHLIISIASNVYLALPVASSLTEGHCLIIPTQHSVASTYFDEDVMREVMMFRSSLTKMFKEKDQDVIFLETVKNLRRQYHTFIECIPVPVEVGDVAPIYFKKAIQESESEWAQNKKLVDVMKNKGIKSAIPKGLPYFSVEFGMDGGFAHVIEDEALFQNYFGKEIIGGILDLEPVKWRKPPKESFQQHKRKVLNFAEVWEPFDWTRDL